MLNELQMMTGNYRYVFPGRNDPNKPMSGERIGYACKVTAHGFRHTLSTILHGKGYNTAWIEVQSADVDKNSIRETYNNAKYFYGRMGMLFFSANFILNQ